MSEADHNSNSDYLQLASNVAKVVAGIDSLASMFKAHVERDAKEKDTLFKAVSSLKDRQLTTGRIGPTAITAGIGIVVTVASVVGMYLNGEVSPMQRDITSLRTAMLEIKEADRDDRGPQGHQSLKAMITANTQYIKSHLEITEAKYKAMLDLMKLKLQNSGEKQK